ncbi:MAG: FAD-dependent oxidoreductase [Gammaproteobacteria bacterium]
MIDDAAAFPVSRRHFIGATGIALGAAALPGALRAALAEDTWDLIVIGGGTAGIPTALFAAERARVLVIEKAPLLGGTLDRSTGQIAAAGTVFQDAKGIEDTPDAHYDDIMRINEHTSDPALTRLFVDNAADALNWLAANGYAVEPTHPVTGSGHEHFRIARYQWGPQGGWSIFQAFEPLIKTAVDERRLSILTNTSAADLIIDSSGAVTGVVATDAEGQRFDLRARNVVLATGGCASNPHMFEELHGVPLYCQVAHPNSQGIGITLGLSAGGTLRGGDKYAPLLGAILANDYYPSPPAAIPPLNPSLRAPWELLVNSNGERFVREDEPSIDHMEKLLAQQPGHRHWAIFDAEILDKAPPLVPDWDQQQVRDASNRQPMFYSADNIGELAVRAGVNPRELRATVEAYNQARSTGEPDPLGLEHRPLPIAKPPFYAIRMQGWTLISFAGLDVDTNLQVLTGDRVPVPNLYAVGEVIGAGATSGQAYTNGMLVTPAITFGRLLGRQILNFG